MIDRGSAATTPHSFEPVRDKFLGQPEAAIRIKRTLSGRARRHHRKAAFGAVAPAILGRVVQLAQIKLAGEDMNRGK